MTLASLRVRHLGDQHTKESMLHYLLMHLLFTELQADSEVTRLRRPKVNFKYGTRLPLLNNGVALEMRIDGKDLGSTTLQRMFLHSEVMVARFELLDLVCDLFQLPRRRESYSSLNCLSWDFGQKFIRQDGKVFWATNTRYSFAYKGRQGQGRRRDCLAIKGTEVVDGVTNSLCMEAIVFITLGDMSLLPFGLPATVSGEIDRDTDSLTFVLGRWFEPHRKSISRDDQHRPICPGALHVNHCLWRYALTSGLRRAVCARNGTPSVNFTRQHGRLGLTPDQMLSHVNADRYAYYGICTPNQILSVVNMCPEFKPDSVSFEYETWLQSLTLI